MNLLMHSLILMIVLIWLYVNLSGLGADKLLHFSIALISSSLENGAYSTMALSKISSRKWMTTSWDWVELKELWRAFYKSFSLIHRCPLNWIALTAGSLCFLTQFISFHGPHFLFAISSILLLKKIHLDFLTVFLKSFQFYRLHVCWYLFSVLWQFLFHQALECLVMLTVFECLNYILNFDQEVLNDFF